MDTIVTRLRSLRDDDNLLRHSIWQDKDSISPGQDWWEAIVEAIIECEVFLFMLSSQSIQNVNCRAELSYARKRNRPIVFRSHLKSHDRARRRSMRRVIAA